MARKKRKAAYPKLPMQRQFAFPEGKPAGTGRYFDLQAIFDKLNAPITHLITEEQARSWVSDWKDVHVDFYVGTSWRISATRPSGD